MKNIFVKLSCLFASSCLIISCSTNTQNQNTAVGAVGGAAVGGGVAALAHASGGVIAGAAVVGALVGGLIGHSADSADKSHMNSSMNHTPTNKASYWKNKKTGVTYKVVPTSNVMSYNGNNTCRTYTATTTMMDGKTEQVNGTACRQANGTWQAIKA